jgi:putative hemolysin
MPLYLQLVRGMTASESGIAMLPLLFGVLIGSMVAGQLARRTQTYKPVLVGGGIVAVLALAILTRMTPETSRTVLTLNLLMLGLGLGPAQGMFTLAIQSAVTHARTGVATAASQFCRQIGATVGVAIFGALLTYQLAAELPRRAPELVEAGQRFELSRAQTLAMDGGALKAALAARGIADPAVTERMHDGLKTSFALSIEGLFPVALALLGLAFIVTLAIPGRRLRGRDDPVLEEREAGIAAVKPSDGATGPQPA